METVQVTMYCSRLVTARIDSAQQEYTSDFTSLGFPDYHLSYHTPSEIDIFDDHLRTSGKYLFDSRGLPIGTQNLTPDERLFILNEQVLVQCDHAYAITRHCKLIDEEGRIERFQFRLAQRILFSIMSELEDSELAIEIMVLKARQLGMTSVVQLLILLRIMFGRGVNAVAASAEMAKSQIMAKKLFMAYDLMPVWLKPLHTARAEETDQPKLVFGQLNTTLSIQHGKKMTGGIAQGWTPTIYHLTECALFPNPDIQIEEGLWRAVHPSSRVLGILESTGVGDQGWWADTWRYSKANWEQNTCRMCPVFLPWFCGTEIYPKPAWLRKHPVPENFYSHRLPHTREHVGKAELYVRTNDILRKYLGPSWKMPLEQQWFWEVGYEEARSKGTESLWFQGMCGDDIEALQRSTESVFGNDVMVEVEERSEKKFDVYAITGQSIESQHEPSTEIIDYDKPRIPIKFRPRIREITYSWELIPLKHSWEEFESLRRNPDAFRDYGDRKLFIFHPPQRGVRYTIGGDTSSGRGHDSSVFSVTSIGSKGAPDHQVAEFRSSWVSHVEAYAFSMALAAHYGQYADQLMDLPLLSIEQIDSVGDICQSEMRKMGYPISRFFDFGRYDGRQVKQVGNRKGWYSNSWSRPILIDSFIQSVKQGWYIVNSPWTMDEMRHFEVTFTASGKEKKQHDASWWDDGIFATAISEFTSHDTQSRTERTQKKYMGTDPIRSLPDIDVGEYRGQTYSTKFDKNSFITDIRDF